MLHHEIDVEFCPGCEEKLTCGHPNIVIYFHMIKIQFPDAHVSWVFRGQFDQDSFFDTGKTHQRWPYSKHNKMDGNKPKSEAMDLFQINKENRAVFSPKFYYDVNSFCEKNNIPLEWSGTWKSFRELDHFQLKEEKEGDL